MTLIIVAIILAQTGILLESVLKRQSPKVIMEDRYNVSPEAFNFDY